jgi:hemoglobin/transferrin/lactoferrin receptor protein
LFIILTWYLQTIIMQKYWVLCILMGWGWTSHSQTITIKDQETKEPIEFVTLFEEYSNVSAVTDIEGQADVSGFKDAKKILIRSLGYQQRNLNYEEIEAQNFLIFLEPSNFSLEEVVVSATRWRQSTSEIPSQIISISSKEVALQNPQTAADLLGLSGKVFVQKSQQGGGSPMIRGFATNRLIYTVDGVRMNNAIFRGGNIQNVISIDPYAVENTEVLFGPGSVIYGSDAIGGVMSFQTLTPQLSTTAKPIVSGKAAARYSSANNEKTGHFDVNVGGKKWAFVTSFSTWDYDHLRQGSNGPDDYIKDIYVQRQDSLDVVITQDDPLLQIPSAYSQLNLMQKVRFQPNENWDFQYGFHFSETSPYGRYDRHNRQRNGTARYAEWYYGPQKWMMNHLDIHHKSGGGVYDQFTLRLAHQSFEESRISRNLNASNRENRREQVEALSANLDFTKSLGSRHTLFYGLEYVQNDVTSDGTEESIITGLVSDGPDRYPQAKWRSMAAYLNHEFRLSDQFSLQGGLRYNHFLLDADFSQNADFYPFPFTMAEIDRGALTGSLGGVYRPSESWVMKVNFGTAFRSPNVDDIGKIFDSEPGAVVVPNPDLKAEYAYNMDLGVAKVFNDAVKVDLTGYYTTLQNAMVRRDFQLNGKDSIVFDGELSQVQAIQNVAVANVFGLQAGIEIKLPDGFRLSSDLNVQQGEEESDDGTVGPSRHAAPWFGRTRLNYRADRLDLQFYAVYQGERAHEDLAIDERGKTEIYALDENGNTYSPAWYTLNIKASYSINESFQVGAGLENLTDQRYRPYSSGISGPGRNFVMSVGVQF